MRFNARLSNQIRREIGLPYDITSILPQTRGAWNFAYVNESGNLLDHSGQARTLTAAGSPTFAVDTYMPYATLDGSTQYFSRADEAGFDITGNLTQLSWAYFDTTAAAAEIIAGKDTAAANYSYFMQRDANGKLSCVVSVDGAALTFAVSTTVISSGNWAFCALRYTASTELAAFLGFQGADDGILEKVVNTTSIPASLFNSNADYTIGAGNVTTTPAFHLDGRVAMTYLCADDLSDNYINMFYSQTRALLDI